VVGGETVMARDETPWQLRMFQKTLKKKMRYRYLKKHLGPLADSDQCLLVTCGDNNGAMNYYLRELGGQWSWADLEDTSIAEMAALLGDEVQHAQADRLPFADATFNRVISIDVHEHLEDPVVFTSELGRVTKPNGQIIITVPNGDETKLAVRIKHAVGMTKEKYGHVRVGLAISELKAIMQESNIEPQADSTFSKFFTEMLELTINFIYVNILARKSKVKVDAGTIAPGTHEQLKSVEKVYKAYSLIYPIYWLISKFDTLLFFTQGYVVVVEGRRGA
jgi:SAM-dependent methyltransferase